MFYIMGSGPNRHIEHMKYESIILLNLIKLENKHYLTTIRPRGGGR